MRVWNSWQDAAEWLAADGASDAVVCVRDWEDGLLTALRWDGRNFFVHPWPFETGAFFFA